jgi:hypothetical protein
MGKRIFPTQNGRGITFAVLIPLVLLVVPVRLLATNVPYLVHHMVTQGLPGTGAEHGDRRHRRLPANPQGVTPEPSPPSPTNLSQQLPQAPRSVVCTTKAPVMRAHVQCALRCCPSARGTLRPRCRRAPLPLGPSGGATPSRPRCRPPPLPQDLSGTSAATWWRHPWRQA